VSHAGARVVSLVPSVTETLLALGVTPVACTRFCEQPGIATVGGTKNPDVGAIVALRPELVVVNDEENRREDAEALAAAGLHVHSMSPRTVTDVGPAVRDLAELLGATVPAPFSAEQWRAWCATRLAGGGPRRRGAVFVWRRPWMTMNEDTYGSSLLAALAIDNVFAADAERYPETTLDEVARREPELVLLPSEPYAFGSRHVAEVAATLDADVRVVDGRDLFWWGIRTPGAWARLGEALAG
jgi:ABC-type Fe3+-hydroxamate transport system substrate-binding protein